MTSFFAEYEKEMMTQWTTLIIKSKNDKARLTKNKQQQVYKQLQMNLKFIRKKMKIYYNLQHENISNYKKRQKVYLSWDNLQTKQSCEKLDFKQLEAFRIKKQHESVTFELELFKEMKIHSIFHTALIKSASDSTSIAKIMNVKEYKDQDYDIEKILMQEEIDEKTHYLVKWKEYDISENTWEFIEHLTKA